MLMLKFSFGLFLYGLNLQLTGIAAKKEFSKAKQLTPEEMNTASKEDLTWFYDSLNSEHDEEDRFRDDVDEELTDGDVENVVDQFANEHINEDEKEAAHESLKGLTKYVLGGGQDPSKVAEIQKYLKRDRIGVDSRQMMNKVKSIISNYMKEKHRRQITG